MNSKIFFSWFRNTGAYQCATTYSECDDFSVPLEEFSAVLDLSIVDDLHDSAKRNENCYFVLKKILQEHFSTAQRIEIKMMISRGNIF
jgi:hypothetical protein